MTSNGRNRRPAPAIGSAALAAALLVASFGLGSPLVSATATDEAGLSFNHDVRPILARCLACHGPDAAARIADLRLDDRDDAIRERRSGRVIHPGDSSSSLLLDRVTSDDPELVMPPPGSGAPLSEREVDVLRRWIEAGAEYERHWAWVHPSASPALPEAGGDWAIRDLDRHVAAFHESAGLEPSPPARLPVLLRRVAIDLVGLPPSPEEIDAAVREAEAIGEDAAYEQFVDRLLDRPAFGERWARIWLDAARYADTKGYEADRRRTMWPWRDWVIRAFNDDVPYDRFTELQLAGDLVPDASPDDVLATAFHRNTMTNDEGGTRDEEFRVAAVVDRVNTTMTTFMGVTAECAACHDHKYDPLPTDEFYGLMAFFNTTRDADRNDERPLLQWLATEDRKARAGLVDDRRRIEVRRDEVLEGLETDAAALPVGRLPILPDVLPPGAVAEGDAPGGAFRWDASVEPPPGWSRARRLEAGADAFAQHYFVEGAPSTAIEIREGDRFEAWVRLDPANPPDSVMIQLHGRPGSWEHRAYFGRNGYAWGVDGTGSLRRVGDLPTTGTWVPLEFSAAEVGLGPGSVVTGVACSMLGDGDGGVAHWGAVSVVRPDAEGPAWLHDADAWIAVQEEIGGRGLSPSLLASVTAGPERSSEDRTRLLRHWRGEVWPEGRRAGADWRDEFARVDAALAEVDARAIPVPVLQEQAASDRRATHVLLRGDWRSPGEEVAASVPAFLHEPDADAPANRLGLARWIASADNPLTARVHVNRVWERLFGLGLVETQEDFGTQGVPPRHQAVLDHLAERFVELGWSHKALCREIATSATYRQSSAASEEAWNADPRNERLARGPRFRLEAEALRDAALAVSGKLSDRMYGPPVFPPQPDGVWQVVYSGDRWTTAEDEDRYRRGLYTFWRRTAPHPAMTTLDVGSRETCNVRRVRTNTPLQALVLLNEASFVEAAGGLAMRGLLEGGPDPAASVTRSFQLALGRSPAARELDVLVGLLNDEAGRFEARPEAALDLLRSARVEAPDGIDPARVAASIVICNVILNLDEFLVRG